MPSPSPNHPKRRLAVVVVTTSVALVAGLLLVACGSPSPEDRLRRVIEQGQQAAEEKDFATLADLVSERYSDGSGRDRGTLLATVQAYLFRFGNVYTAKREVSLAVTAPGRAEVTLVVAVAAAPIEVAAPMEDISADVLRVDMAFEEEDGDWKLIGCAWTGAEPSDLF